MAKYLFTSESVTEGHPDKICDQISDAVLDAILDKDPTARVACETAVTTGMVMIMVTTMCLYILLFTNSAGEWGRELAKPYLYLVPAGPFAKLLWASLTSLIKPLVDGVVIFLGVGIAAGARPFTTVMCMLLYASFGALFTAANILSQRLFGKAGNQGLLLFLYVLMLMILVLPGLAGGIPLGVLMDMGILPATLPTAIMALPMIVWNLMASFGIYALCRGALHDMEAQ